MEWFNRSLFYAGDVRVTTLSVMLGLVVLAAFGFLSLWAAAAWRKALFARGHGHPSTVRSFLRVWHILMWLAGLLTALWVAGLPVGGFAAVLGLFAIAAALWARGAGASYISGLILLYERPFAVGDLISTGELEGEVESVRLRATILRTADNARLVVPNAELTKRAVTNWSATDHKLRLRIPVTVPQGSDQNQVTNVLRRVAERNSRVRKNPSPRVIVTRLHPEGIDFELWAWVGEPAERAWVTNELCRGIDSELRRVEGLPAADREGRAEKRGGRRGERDAERARPRDRVPGSRPRGGHLVPVERPVVAAETIETPPQEPRPSGAEQPEFTFESAAAKTAGEDTAALAQPVDETEFAPQERTFSSGAAELATGPGAPAPESGPGTQAQPSYGRSKRKSIRR